jgi:hypothetical protein
MCGLPELLAALKARRTRQTELTRTIGALERQGQRVSDESLRDELRRRVTAWQQLMSRHATQARQILRKMLRGRTIQFEPTTEDGVVGYRFRGEASVSELLAGLTNLPLMVTSPTGFDGCWSLADESLESWNDESIAGPMFRRVIKAA